MVLVLKCRCTGDAGIAATQSRHPVRGWLLAMGAALALLFDCGCSEQNPAVEAENANQSWARDEKKAQLDARVQEAMERWQRERDAQRHAEDHEEEEMVRARQEKDVRSVREAERVALRVALLREDAAARNDDLRYFALKEVPLPWQDLQEIRARLERQESLVATMDEANAGKFAEAITLRNQMKRIVRSAESRLEKAFVADVRYQDEDGRAEFALAKEKALVAMKSVLVSAKNLPESADSRDSQIKIAQFLARRDSGEARAKVHDVLVDDAAILELVCTSHGADSDLASWAAGLGMSPKTLETALYETSDEEVASRLLAQLDEEDSLARVARSHAALPVRAAAAGRLGKGKEQVLLTLAEDQDAGVREAAMSALESIDYPVAGQIKEEHERIRQEEQKKRAEFLRTRTQSDMEDRVAEETKLRKHIDGELQELYRDIDVQAKIRTCRDWGRMQLQGTRVKKRSVEFSGTVTKVETHWLGADEVWVEVDCRGERYGVHAKIAEGDSVVLGNHVLVTGLFTGGDAMLVHLKNASVRKR